MCHKVEEPSFCFLTYFPKLYFWFPSTICLGSILMPFCSTVPQKSEKWFTCSLHCGYRSCMYCAMDGSKTETYLVVSKNIFIDYSGLLGCCALFTGECLPTLRKNCMPSSSCILMNFYPLCKNYISFIFIKYNVLYIFVLPGDGQAGRNMLYWLISIESKFWLWFEVSFNLIDISS
jgi:hypothetical protein